MTKQIVLMEFMEAHEEWLSLGGNIFRDYKRPEPSPPFYESQYWKLVRQAVLASKEFKCCRCGGKATQVHHLNYDHIGEDHFFPESLVAICYRCHGLVEYARKAEALISRIRRRISLSKGFLEGARGCSDQNATHMYARLLEYRDQLAELQRLFSRKTHYSNPPLKLKEDRSAVAARMKKHDRKDKAYHKRAEKLVSEMGGDEREKAERIWPMLEEEIRNCQEFVSEVFAPISSPAKSSTYSG